MKEQGRGWRRRTCGAGAWTWAGAGTGGSCENKTGNRRGQTALSLEQGVGERQRHPCHCTVSMGHTQHRPHKPQRIMGIAVSYAYCPYTPLLSTCWALSVAGRWSQHGPQ